MEAFKEEFPDLGKICLTNDKELSAFYIKHIAREEGWRAALQMLLNKFTADELLENIIRFIDLELEQK